MTTLHPVVAEVTERLRERSRDTRAAYLARIDAVDRSGPQRGHLSCGNLAHGFAACGSDRQGGVAQRPSRQPGDRHRLQRHAVRASALRTLSRTDPPDRARQRLHRAGRRRRAGDVRRHHPGPRRHAAVAVLARRDRDGHRGGVVARHVRRRAVPGHLRQDRAGPADRRAELRPSARGLRAQRADAQRHPQRAEVESAPGLRRRQGQQGGTARSRSGLVPRAGHLHLLWHRQLQPDADGDHGPAPARRQLHRAGYPAARRAHRRGGAPRRRRQRTGRRTTCRSATSSTSARSSTA